MRARGLTFLSVVLALIFVLGPAVGPCGELPSHDQSIYDPDPQHLWNQLNDTLFVRSTFDGKRYGPGDLDILFWSNTTYLLKDPSHQTAIQILDRFIQRQGEKFVRDPLKRAMLQRDLWALFEWSALPNATDLSRRAALQTRLAIILRRLALNPAEIAALPDNYAAAAASPDNRELPRGLFDPNSSWAVLGVEGSEVTALTHTQDFNGHSLFLVLARFPEGRPQATAYLKQLRDFEHPLIHAKQPGTDRESLTVNPALPQFPVGTEWALVRKLCVINPLGEIVPTHFIESIEVRRYVSIPATFTDLQSMRDSQQRLAFTMDRRDGGRLHAVAPGTTILRGAQFRSTGFDPIDHINAQGSSQELSRFQVEPLRECVRCHQSPGILSINSYNRTLFSGGPIQPLSISNTEREATALLHWKHRQRTWELLKHLWRTNDLR